jgi:GDP/UDP-N,N'-diacetylbacillosamine 2-epimerase (hydrolysing)
MSVSAKRKILYVSGSRADYGPVRDLLRAIDESDNLDLGILVTAMHLKAEHGMTVNEIARDGFDIVARVGAEQDSDTLVMMSKSFGKIIIGIGRELARHSPDILLLLGDRGEQLSAAIAGAIQNITIVHMCGGGNSGSIDDSFRHAISKFAHYHLPISEAHARRLMQMGELPETIHVVGLPGGNLRKHVTYSPSDIRLMYDLPLEEPYLLVLQHPVTHSSEQAFQQISATLEAVVEVGRPTLLANPNGDPGGSVMQTTMNSFAAQYENLRLLPPPGNRELFASVMAHSAVLIGNSSSAVGEAMSVGLPVVNIGDRQSGRECDANWINVDYDRQQIIDGICVALHDTEYRARLTQQSEFETVTNNDYRTAELLAGFDLSRGCRSKQFYDLGVNATENLVQDSSNSQCG